MSQRIKAAVAASMFVVTQFGCATARHNPNLESERFVRVFNHSDFSASEPFWFNHAIIYFDYHGTSISPAEILDPSPVGLALRAALLPRGPCPGGRGLVRRLKTLGHARIAGRGQFRVGPDGRAYFVIDCLCEVQPIQLQPDQAERLIGAGAH